MGHSEHGMTAGIEIAVHYEYKAEHYLVGAVGFNIKPAVFYNLRVVGEDAYKQVAFEKCNKVEDYRYAKAYQNAAPHTFFRALRLTGAYVVGGHGRNA